MNIFWNGQLLMTKIINQWACYIVKSSVYSLNWTLIARHGQWGGVSQNPPVIEKIGKTPPCPEKPDPPPPSPREARRQNFMVLLGNFPVNFGNFR